MIFVEVLHTIAGVEITDTTAWGWIFLAFLVLGFVCIGTWLEAPLGNGDGFGKFGLTMLVIAIVIVIFAPFKEPTGQFEPTRHEVIVTDPNFVIDATKYKVIKTEGKIITIEEVKK
jgi:hypothetical protein